MSVVNQQPLLFMSLHSEPGKAVLNAFMQAFLSLRRLIFDPLLGLYMPPRRVYHSLPKGNFGSLKRERNGKDIQLHGTLDHALMESYNFQKIRN